MGKQAVAASVIISLFAFVGCKPDLLIEDMEIMWDADHKEAKASIANEGRADAGNFMVYFNADEDPVSPNHRPQVRFNVEELAKGATTELHADFAPLAHPDNNQLGNVYQITLLVDPKMMVSESNEDNNQREIPLP